MTGIPDHHLRAILLDDLRSLPTRKVRAIASDVRRERELIQQEAVAHGATHALGVRLADVEELAKVCHRELARRRRFSTLRRAFVAAIGIMIVVGLASVGIVID